MGGGGGGVRLPYKKDGCWCDGGVSHQRLQVDMMFKTLHGLTSEYLQSRFVSRNDITCYCLRNSENKLALTQSTS